MRHLILETHEGERTGTWGLVVAGTQRSELLTGAIEGSLVAHDIIEHVNGVGMIGEPWDELEALGASWCVRGRWCDYPGISSAEEGVANDLVFVFEDWLQNRWAPRSHQYRHTKSHYCDEDFDAIIDLGRKRIVSDIAYHDEDYCTLGDVDTYLIEAKHRMRIGYRKAHRKYGDRFYGGNLFHRIEDAVNNLKREEYFEGQTFRLRYNDVEAFCEEIEPEYAW